MARIVSLIQYVGKAGNTVGQKGRKGGIVLKQLPASVSNPRTDAQMRNRAKMKLAAQVAGMLGEVGRASLIANGHKKSDRGLLIKRLLQNVVVNADGSQATLQYDLHLVDNPSYAKSLTMQLASDSSQYTATFGGAAEGEAIAKCIMVHDLNTGLWRHTASLDTANTLSIAKSANESGNALEVFAYGIVLTPKSGTTVATLGQTGANQSGFVLDLNRVSTTLFDFSPSLCASLNVAGNGSQSGDNGGNGGSGNQEPAVTANVTITANANDAQMGSVTGGGTYVQGASVTLTATANEGYHFVSWSNGRTTASITVTADADATYTATFAADGQGGSGDNSGMDG